MVDLSDQMEQEIYTFKVVAGVMKPTKEKVLVGGNIYLMIELGAGFDLT